ncbi:hypothetical protein ACLOJK_019927 [Asimina triloba]
MVLLAQKQLVINNTQVEEIQRGLKVELVAAQAIRDVALAEASEAKHVAIELEAFKMQATDQIMVIESELRDARAKLQPVREELRQIWVQLWPTPLANEVVVQRI